MPSAIGRLAEPGPQEVKVADRLAADAVVDVGHEAGDGLVVDGDGLDVVRALVQRVDEADIAVPAQAEHVRHLLAHEIVDDHLTAVEHVPWHWLSLFIHDLAPSCLRA